MNATCDIALTWIAEHRDRLYALDWELRLLAENGGGEIRCSEPLPNGAVGMACPMSAMMPGGMTDSLSADDLAPALGLDQAAARMIARAADNDLYGAPDRRVRGALLDACEPDGWHRPSK